MRKLLLTIIFIISAVNIYAQGAIEKRHQLSDKVFFGGGLGMQFGTTTAISVSPIVGYKPIDDLYFGLKGKYEYYKYSRYNIGTDIYGGSIFGMYLFYESIAIYGEYEMLSLESEYYSLYQPSSKSRFWLKTPLIGGGYIQSLSGRAKIMLLVLWNLNDNYNYYYSNPIIRLSFLF
jgi:hypothetical protein